MFTIMYVVNRNLKNPKAYKSVKCQVKKKKKKCLSVPSRTKTLMTWKANGTAVNAFRIWEAPLI